MSYLRYFCAFLSCKVKPVALLFVFSCINRAKFLILPIDIGLQLVYNALRLVCHWFVIPEPYGTVLIL